MADFNVSINNRITHQLGEIYLPIRCMTCDELGVYGNCAIIGCNIGHSNLGRYTFSLFEDSKTEYFIFPKNHSLYNELVDKMYQQKSWRLNSAEWIPTIGKIFDKEKIVYFHQSFEIGDKTQSLKTPFFTPITNFEYSLVDTVSDYKWAKYYLPLHSYNLDIFDDKCILTLCNPIFDVNKSKHNYIIDENTVFFLYKQSSRYKDVVNSHLEEDTAWRVNNDEFFATLGKINNEFRIILASKDFYDDELLEFAISPNTIELTKKLLSL